MTKALLLGTVLLSTSSVLLAGTPIESQPDCCATPNLWTGEGVSIGNWFFPEVNYLASAGSSTINPARLAVGHHDPDRHGVTQQAFEVAATIRLNEHIAFFGTYSGKVDLNDHWLSEFEEYYAILDLPADIRIRGGRLQPRFGYQNELHIHDFDYVDQYLSSARMFGEDPLVIYGGELSLPVLRKLPSGWDDRLTVSFGAVPDPEEEDHEHFGPEGEFESEGNLFADWAATVNYRLGWNPNHSTRYEFGFAGAWGGNEFGRNSQIYGLQFEYLWKSDGVAHDDARGHHHEGETGEFFRWRTEAFVRYFGAVSGHSEEEEEEHAEPEPTIIPGQPEVREMQRTLRGYRWFNNAAIPVYSSKSVIVKPATPSQEVEAEEEEHHDEEPPRRDDFTDFGIYTTATYGFRGGKVQARLRGEYVSGISEAGLSERWRVSPAVAWHPFEQAPIHFKLQYNFDHSPSFGSEHSIWAQVSVNWGDCCAH